MAKWTRARIARIAQEIDHHNDTVVRLVQQIRESGFPNSSSIAQALDEECVILACAYNVVEDLLEQFDSAKDCGAVASDD